MPKEILPKISNYLSDPAREISSNEYSEIHPYVKKIVFTIIAMDLKGSNARERKLKAAAYDALLKEISEEISPN